MKSLLRLLPFLALAFVSLAAAEDKSIAAARAADDERVAATKAGDGVRLESIYSEQLHYAHSSGTIDTKASLIKSLVSRSTIYESIEYQERKFVPAGPGVVLMYGRAMINAGSKGAISRLDLNYLAVWREENGKWRFFAWQSCKNPVPVPPAK